MAKSALISKVLKIAGKDSNVNVLSQSNFLDKDVICQSYVPIFNLMLGGSFEGGITPGVHQLVGDSRTFKTLACLSLMKAFLDHDPEAIAIFLDSEFGASKYFKTFGIDEDRVIHIPLEDIEQLKFKLTQIVDGIELGEKVFIFIDSISQLASKKEVSNAMEENAAADMTRARELNSFFRIITPKLQMRKIPLFAINSFYADMTSKWAAPVIKGGKQSFLSSDVILFVTRSQIKDDKTKELQGWSFNYTCMKSRYVKENAKFSIEVTYEGGINKNSGLFELAQEAGFITSEKQGWYNINNLNGYDSEKSVRKAQIEQEDAFFEQLVANKEFRDFCYKKYSLETGAMFTEADVVTEE